MWPRLKPVVASEFQHRSDLVEPSDWEGEVEVTFKTKLRVVQTGSYCRDMGSIPGQGTKIRMASCMALIN